MVHRRKLLGSDDYRPPARSLDCGKIQRILAFDLPAQHVVRQRLSRREGARDATPPIRRESDAAAQSLPVISYDGAKVRARLKMGCCPRWSVTRIQDCHARICQLEHSL
jgi:hypothetical protein